MILVNLRFIMNLSNRDGRNLKLDHRDIIFTKKYFNLTAVESSIRKHILHINKMCNILSACGDDIKRIFIRNVRANKLDDF
jgi:hypothetical protein